ncbi:MAG: hypothetical protein VX294_11365 [Candidatus Latescibacterota bacterium]|nr:hypothetical protein [Candidatus Latescibacterota bacterium]
MEPFQRNAQIILIWLIPFVAAIGIWLYYRSQEDTTHRKRDDTNSSGYSGVCSGGCLKKELGLGQQALDLMWGIRSRSSHFNRYNLRAKFQGSYCIINI